MFVASVRSLQCPHRVRLLPATHRQLHTQLHDLHGVSSRYLDEASGAAGQDLLPQANPPVPVFGHKTLRAGEGRGWRKWCAKCGQLMELLRNTRQTLTPTSPPHLSQQIIH